MPLKTPFIGTETQSGAPITTDLLDVKIRQNLEDLANQIDRIMVAPTAPLIPTTPAGLTLAEVDARILPFARAGNTDDVPEDKLPFATPDQRGIVSLADRNDADTGTNTLFAMTPELTTRVVNAATTGAAIKGKLEGLSGANRLDASAIKNLPTGGGMTTGPSADQDHIVELDSAPTAGLGTTYPEGSIIRTGDKWLELVEDDAAVRFGIKIAMGRDGNNFGLNKVSTRLRKIGSSARENDRVLDGSVVGAFYVNLSNGQMHILIAADALPSSLPGTIYFRIYDTGAPAETTAFDTDAATRSAGTDTLIGGVQYRSYVTNQNSWPGQDTPPNVYVRFFTSSPPTNNQTSNPLNLFDEFVWHEIDEPNEIPVHDADLSHDVDFVAYETDHVELRPVTMQYQDDLDNKFFQANVQLTGEESGVMRVYQRAHGDNTYAGRLSLVLGRGTTRGPFNDSIAAVNFRVGETGSFTRVPVRRDTEFSNSFALISTNPFSADPAGFSGTSHPSGVKVYFNFELSNGELAYNETETITRKKVNKTRLVQFVNEELNKNPARVLQRVTSFPSMADDGTEVFLIADIVIDGQLSLVPANDITLSGTIASDTGTDLLSWVSGEGAVYYLYERSDNGNVIVMGAIDRSVNPPTVGNFGGFEYQFNKATKTFGSFVRAWLPGGRNPQLTNAYAQYIHLYGEFFLSYDDDWQRNFQTDDYIKVYRFNETLNQLEESRGNKPTATVDFKTSSTTDTRIAIGLHGYDTAGGFVFNGVLYLIVQGRPETSANQQLSTDTSTRTGVSGSNVDAHKLSLVAFDIDNTSGAPRFTYNYSKSIFYFYEWRDNNDNPVSIHSNSYQRKAYLRGSTFYITQNVENSSSATANLKLEAFDLSLSDAGVVSVSKSVRKTSDLAPGFALVSDTSGPTVIDTNIDNDFYLRRRTFSLTNNKLIAASNTTSERRGIYVKEGLLWSAVQRAEAPAPDVGVSKTPRRVIALPAESESLRGERVYVTGDYTEARGVDITPQSFAGTELDGLGLGTRGWYSKPDAGFEFGDIKPDLDDDFVLISDQRVYVKRNTQTNLTHIVLGTTEYPLVRVPQAAGTKILSNPAYAANQPDVDYYTITGGLPAGDWDFVRFKATGATAAATTGTNLRFRSATSEYVYADRQSTSILNNIGYSTASNPLYPSRWNVIVEGTRSDKVVEAIIINDTEYPMTYTSDASENRPIYQTEQVTTSGQFPTSSGTFTATIRVRFTDGSFYNFTTHQASFVGVHYLPAIITVKEGYYFYDGSDWQFDDYQAPAIDTTKNFTIKAAEGGRVRTLNKTALDGLTDARIQVNNTALNLKTVWYGSQAEFDAISVKDEDTEYNIYAS